MSTLEEEFLVVGGSVNASGHLALLHGSRKWVGEVRFTLVPAPKIAKVNPGLRILGTKAATIPANHMVEPTVTLLTTTSSTPHSTGARLSSVTALASHPVRTPTAGGSKAVPWIRSALVLPTDADSTGRNDGHLDSVFATGERGSKILPGKTPTLTVGAQTLSSGSTSRNVQGSGRPSTGGACHQAPAASGKSSHKAEEEIIIDDEEEELLEDVDTDEDDELSPLQLLQKATSCVKWVGNKGRDEDYSLMGYKKSDMIRFLCNPLYLQDSDGVQEVQGYILGLDKGIKPTRRQVNQSPLFKLRPPPPGEEKNPGVIVADYWIEILTEEGMLGDCHPKDYLPPEGYGKLYTCLSSQHLKG